VSSGFLFSWSTLVRFIPADGRELSYDLIALGETMIALAPPAGTSLQTAPHLLVDHAGAESNTCVGLARLGFRVAWVSRLGSDAAGDRVIDALAAEGVDVRWVRRDPRRPTGWMVKEPGARVRYCRTGSAASDIGPDDLEEVPVAGAKAVLVSGVTALIGERPQQAAVALLSAARGLRIVDPNFRQGLWGSDRRVELVLPLVERCNLLLTGAQEVGELLGQPSASPLDERGDDASLSGERGDDEALARRATERGPREVVVRGRTSVGALTDGSWQAITIQRTDAVDPIGAGDAFNAGYIAVRLRGGSIEEALRAGIRCGTAVTSTPSDTAGFPRTIT
jgi:2-dehydro-3-deoxygluconokinase